MRKFLSLMLLMAFSVSVSLAQTRVITGKVTDEKGDPYPYASIKIKDGKGGTSADQNGVFKIQVKDGTVLVISAVNGAEKEVTITAGSNNITVVLKKTSTELAEVVVGALGIKRTVKSTPYAAQQISAERLTQTRETDLNTALTGKIAGLQVIGASGAKLGSSGITRLRGVSGFADRGAIYVVDGTIVTNVSDINMDDVASVSVLKGPNATALYGQRAEGGVIIITTKRVGKNKPLTVEFNSTTTFEKVNILPEYQNLYGGGNNSDPNKAWAENAYTWKSTDPVEWKALQGYRRQQYFDDASWGPKFDGGDYIPWYSWYGGHSRSYKPAKWTPQEDNIRDFYRTGLTTNNNISLSTSNNWWSTRFSYTYLLRNGIVPQSDQKKHYISTQNTFELNKHFSIGANVGVTFEKFTGDSYDEYGNNTTGSFSQWFHRDLDMGILKELRGLKSPTGTFASWNLDDAAGISPTAITNPAFWFNPYTWVDNFSSVTDRFRVLGDVSLTYKLNNDFKVTGTYRMNYRTTENQVKIPQVLENSSGTGGTGSGAPGGGTYDEVGGTLYSKYKKNNTKYIESNIEVIAQYTKKINKFTFDFVGGGNILNIKRDDSSRTTNGGLIVPDVFAINNSKSAAGLGATLSYREVRSLFFKGTIGYKDLVFLDFSGRNDWSSTLPKNNNSYFYPSIGASFVFSDLLKNPDISYAKFRASAAQIGSDPLNPYALQFLYTTGNIPFGTNPLSTVPGTFIDPNIKSPLNTSFELGLDMKFFKNRIGFSTTVYREERKNEIVTTSVSNASGFSSGTINAGKIMRKGIEFEFNAKPVVTKNFMWDFSFNWAKNFSKVITVSDKTDLFTIYSNYVGQPIVIGTAGKEWGQMRANGIERMDGKPVIDPTTGLYMYKEDVDFGSVLPLYNGGFFNSFTYKNVTLSASIDFQNGGKYFSFSDFNGKYSGLNKETAGINDKGVNVREPISAGGGVHVYGVTPSGKSYDAYVNAYDYYRQFNDNSIWDYSIFDASYIKLREVSLGYEIPVKKLGSISKTVKRANLSFVARNLWMIYTANKNIDPTEMADTYAENGQLPGTKSYGINLKIVF